MKLVLVFCCLLGVTTVYGDGFYFPDENGAKADSNSNAWSDGYGNSQANANSNAVASGTGGSRYPEFYKPNHGGHGQRYPVNGYDQFYDRRPHNYPRPPYQPQYPQSNGQANANAQANSQNFGNGGSSLSNAISNSNVIGPNGEAAAAAAAASAGTSFVNGVPVSSAAAAASAASSNGGSSSSSANSGGNRGPRYPGAQYQRPYGNQFYNGQQIRPWQYRSGVDDDEAEVVEAETASARSNDDGESKVVFKD